MQVPVVGDDSVEPTQAASALATPEKSPAQFIKWTFKVFFWPEVIAIAWWVVPLIIYNVGPSAYGLITAPVAILWLVSWVAVPGILIIHLLLIVLVPITDHVTRKYGNDLDD